VTGRGGVTSRPTRLLRSRSAATARGSLRPRMRQFVSQAGSGATSVFSGCQRQRFNDITRPDSASSSVWSALNLGQMGVPSPVGIPCASPGVVTVGEFPGFCSHLPV